MRWAAWSMVAALSFAFARGASAQPAPATATATPEVFHPYPRVHVFAHLSFTREPDALICPEERWFRDALGAHMGIDSFAPNPRGAYVGRVRVVLSRIPGGFAGTYTWDDAEGATQSARFVRRGDTRYHCQDALEDIVTVFYVRFGLIELDLGARYDRPKTPAPPCPTIPPCATPPPCRESPYSVWPPEPPLRGPAPDPPAPPERWPFAVRVGAALWPERIAVGGGSLGFSADVGARYRAVSLGVEAHGDPPLGSFQVGNLGTVNLTRLSGALLLCAHFGWFTGCGVGDAGRIFFPHHISLLPSAAFYGSAGVRAGLEFPVAPPRLFIRAALDLRAPIQTKVYSFMGNTVFEAAGPSVGLGLGFLAELHP